MRTARRLTIATSATLLLAACATGPDDDPDAAGVDGGGATWELTGDAVFPEGIAVGEDGSFYVGSTRDGAIHRGDVDDPDAGTEVLLDPGTDERSTVTGLTVDGDGRLWVAGRDSNLLFVYDLDDGLLVDRWSPPAVDRTLLNDVAVTADAAYVTDSFRPTLFRVPLTADGPGDLEQWIDLDDTPIEYEEGFNLNGIVATPDGGALLVVQYNTGQLFRIDTSSGSVAEVDLGDGDLSTGDGMVLDGELLHVVLGGPGEIATVRLADDLASGEVVARTTDPSWRAPTTIAATDDGRLLVVNSQLNMTGADDQPTLPFTVSSVELPRPAAES